MLPSQTLPDFQQYLVSRKLAPGKSVTFYAYWANRYLTFSKRLKNADAIPQVDVCFLCLPPGFPAAMPAARLTADVVFPTPPLLLTTTTILP
jgi:hypothetical protein